MRPEQKSLHLNYAQPKRDEGIGMYLLHRDIDNVTSEK